MAIRSVSARLTWPPALWHLKSATSCLLDEAARHGTARVLGRVDGEVIMALTWKQGTMHVVGDDTVTTYRASCIRRAGFVFRRWDLYLGDLHIGTCTRYIEHTRMMTCSFTVPAPVPSLLPGVDLFGLAPWGLIGDGGAPTVACREPPFFFGLSCPPALRWQKCSGRRKSTYKAWPFMCDHGVRISAVIVNCSLFLLLVQGGTTPCDFANLLEVATCGLPRYLPTYMLGTGFGAVAPGVTY